MQSSRSVVLSLDSEERSRLELAAHVQGLSVEQLLRAAVGLPRERQPSKSAPRLQLVGETTSQPANRR